MGGRSGDERFGSVRMRHEIVARPGGGCIATLTVEGPPAIVVGYPEVARIALGRLVRAS